MPENDVNSAEQILAEESPEPATEAAAEAAEPAAKTPDSGTSKKKDASRRSSPLLGVLTVLLVLVGIADVILWGIVGYYLLQGRLNGNREEPPQSISSSGTLPSNGGAASGSSQELDPLEIYIQEMQGIWERDNEETDYYNSIKAMDDAEFYAELTQRTIPSFRQIFEDASAVTSDDPKVAELCKVFQEYGVKWMDSCEEMVSALEDQNWILRKKANLSITATNHFWNGYWKDLRKLAEERGVSFDG